MILQIGITLKTVEIQDISPSSTMQMAMEEQAAAERQRRATVTKADGQRQAAIAEADGRLRHLAVMPKHKSFLHVVVSSRFV